MAIQWKQRLKLSKPWEKIIFLPYYPSCLSWFCRNGSKRLPLTDEVAVASCRISHVASHMSHLTCRISHLTCHILHVTSYMSHLTCRILHVTSRMSHLACRILHLACHISHVASYMSHVSSRMSLVSHRSLFKHSCICSCMQLLKVVLEILGN